MGSNGPLPNNSIAGAITYPNRSNDNVELAQVQPRQPRNLQGLLRFAMEATKAEDAPGNSELGPIDEERRRFLEEALRSLTVDMAQVIQESIKILTDREKMGNIKMEQPLPVDVDEAFNKILDLIDDIDLANDFYKMGGFAMFPVCYGSDNAEVRARASSLLAELCQNNPFCQAKALECGLLNVLMNLIDTETDTALVKCLYAVSCITRECPAACRELVSGGGCGSLARRLTAPEPSARTKAAFLIAYLCTHYPDAKEQFIQLNVVALVTEQISQRERDDSTEHMLSTLLALVEGSNPVVLAQCRNPTVGLKSALERHLQHPDLMDDTFREEKDYCRQLLRKIFQGPYQVPFEEVADR